MPLKSRRPFAHVAETRWDQSRDADSRDARCGHRSSCERRAVRRARPCSVNLAWCGGFASPLITQSDAVSTGVATRTSRRHSAGSGSRIPLHAKFFPLPLPLSQNVDRFEPNRGIELTTISSLVADW